jgi:hypothetical protein
LCTKCVLDIALDVSQNFLALMFTESLCGQSLCMRKSRLQQINVLPNPRLLWEEHFGRFAILGSRTIWNSYTCFWNILGVVKVAHE